MTRSRSKARGYHTPPDGLARRREAISPLPRRSRQGTRAEPGQARESHRRATRPERDGKSRYRGPGPKTTARRPRKIRWSRELAIALVLIVLFFIVWGVVGYLTFRSGVSAANKRLPRTAKSRARTGSGPTALEPELDPAARHRPLARRVAKRRPALRLDHAPTHRSRPRAALLPLDPARPARRDPGLRGEQDQHRVPGRRAPARRAHRRRVHRHPGQPPRGGELRRVQGPDRQDRRNRRHRQRPDPLQVRLPLRQRGPLRSLAGLALRQGQSAPERPPRAHLLARSQEPAEPR